MSEPAILSPMDETLRVLTTLRELLARYGYDERASFIEDLDSPHDSEDFWLTLSGLEFWGGAGAVWEVEPFQYSHPDVASSQEDYRRFQGLMVELAGILESKGMSALASGRADLFRRELEDGS